MINRLAKQIFFGVTPPILTGLIRQLIHRSKHQQNDELKGFHESKQSIESDEYIQWICQILGGWLSAGHGNIAAFDYAIKQMPENGAVIEIGSFLGLSTNIIAYLTIKHDRKNPFFSCDPWLFECTEEPIGGYFDASRKEYRDYAKKVFEMNLELFSGNRKPYAIEDLSGNFLENWHAKSTAQDVFGRSIEFGGSISFAYIDGAHTYEAAKEDFLGIDRYLLPGGFVLFDDSADDSPFDCKKVVAEVIANPAYELVCKTPNYFFRKIK
ncbi:class I SAM-dependent methyltransferase [Tumidithrix elongata RA019]|uniref:Class I SAM-dependent methyltransferase n=1 Tax=Tumidithrix elongata BACA0141 TaxID=2716417 RepID=A0AAW9Q436_9CYAN|nr:class I SAM-dependent methyltransferase [Tumidithrix elongata RA019]